MNKSGLIEIINKHYPADSEDAAIARTGRQLLQQARDLCGQDWRSENNKVLAQYAALCIEENALQTADARGVA